MKGRGMMTTRKYVEFLKRYFSIFTVDDTRPMITRFLVDIPVMEELYFSKEEVKLWKHLTR